MNKEFYAGKKVLVMGLGRFGGGVDVAVSDSIKKLEKFPDIEFHLDSHDSADFQQADIIIANPTVAPDNEFLEFACRHNKFITSQINIFFELCPAPIIGITGAVGKSTTAALTAHLFKKSRCNNVWLSGNIGNEPLLTIMDRISSNDLVVLELSSFQLEQLAQIQKAPKVALLTNLTPNHLDRYGTFDDYCAAKENIFKFQKPDRNRPAVSIFNAEDKIAAEWFEKYKNDTGRTCIKFSTDDVTEEMRKNFSLPGQANLSNLAAAVAITRYFGIDDDLIKTSLLEFKPLPHRLELVAKIDGICWYNDSKATTPESAIAALEAFEQPTIIIAGGYDKNMPFDELGEKIARNAKAAVLLGHTAKKIADAIRAFPQANTTIEIVSSLSEAVDLAGRLAVSGDVVLLSPACASYDMFDNFEHRGREFTKLVQKISD
jgi:UDP-N-acetylmuramoylalanine--D-glutamate ligase